MSNKARDFAMQAHGEQRYGAHSYVYHLDAVAEICGPYGETAETVAFLHDVVEDTAVTLEQLEAEFGEFVCRCVAILSDEPGNSRADRKAASYEKMANVQGEESLALLVKAADRLANMRACLSQGKQKMLEQYKAEHASLRRAAYRPGLCDEIWSELSEISQA